eukprot:2619406-Pleurochrysis_carterae.AAC.1
MSVVSLLFGARFCPRRSRRTGASRASTLSALRGHRRSVRREEVARVPHRRRPPTCLGDMRLRHQIVGLGDLQCNPPHTAI